MSITERSTEHYRFSAYDSNEAKRRMRSLNLRARSNEESMEPETFPENKTWRSRFIAFQQGVTRRIAAPRVTTTVARPFFSLFQMTGSILMGLFPLHLIGRAAGRGIRRFRSSFTIQSSKTFREYGVQTEDGDIEEISEMQNCQRDERAFCQCQPNY